MATTPKLNPIINCAVCRAPLAYVATAQTLSGRTGAPVAHRAACGCGLVTHKWVAAA